MLGLDFIRTNLETVEKAIRDKGVNLDLDSLIMAAAEVRHLKTEIEGLRAERNSISASFKDAAPEDRATLGAKAGEFEKRLGEKEEFLNALLMRVPNIPWEGAPNGPDETFNTVVRKEGEPPSFDFEPLDHVALVEKNDWADLARIT